VFVAGGTGSTSGAAAILSSAELYDPATNTWSPAASMATARDSSTATLLPSGKVLVAGGSGFAGILSSAELYDPAGNSWSSAGSMAIPRDEATATLLPSGKVLVAGGASHYDCCTAVASAELYDPATNSWSPAASMATARYGQTATLLPNGKVLVAGGAAATAALASAELYDPATNTWSSAGSMASPRAYATATLLPSGKVLVAGGYGRFGDDVPSAELYDPATNRWSSAGRMATGRDTATATLLPSGQVLVAGGEAASESLASAELYDPATNTWSSAGSMAMARRLHTATLLPSGQVLVAGGLDGGFDPSAELYTPTPVPTASGRMGTLGAKLRFTVTCEGAIGQSCHGQATATAVEKLAANGTIIGALLRKPRAGRYRVVNVLKGNWTAAAGHGTDISISLNSTGQMLRTRFKRVPFNVTIMATTDGISTVIRAASVTFARHAPTTRFAAAPTTKHDKAHFEAG
jgi:N-acetylneuraminic acid mutarotase